MILAFRAFFLVSSLEDGGVPLVTPDLLHVLDDGAVLHEELHDRLYVLTGALPGVAGQVEVLTSLAAGAAHQGLQGWSVKLEKNKQ